MFLSYLLHMLSSAENQRAALHYARPGDQDKRLSVTDCDPAYGYLHGELLAVAVSSNTVLQAGKSVKNMTFSSRMIAKKGKQ
jgi:hypothetical protein